MKFDNAYKSQEQGFRKILIFIDITDRITYIWLKIDSSMKSRSEFSGIFKIPRPWQNLKMNGPESKSVYTKLFSGRIDLYSLP